MIEILCTVGPNSINKNFLTNLKRTRVTTLRINLSHTKINEIKKVYKKSEDIRTYQYVWILRALKLERLSKEKNLLN